MDLSSDSEGFLDDHNGNAAKSAGKNSAASLKAGGKRSVDSMKSGGKAPEPSMGFSGKGGKDYKGGKGGGKGAAKPKVLLETDAKLSVELPKNAKILMDCEAADIFEGIQDFLSSLSQNPSVKMPASYAKALQHVQNGVQYTSSKSARQVLDKLKKVGASDGEICMIANICPETLEEVYALVPSLKDKRQKNEKAILDALSELEKLRSANATM